jgi:hypothetical protein
MCSTSGSNINTKIISRKNSQPLNLNPGQSYVGIYEDVSEYALATVSVFIKTDIGEKCVLTVETSADFKGRNSLSQSWVVTTSANSVQQLTITSQCFRVSIVCNQGTGIVNGYIQTMYHRYKAASVVITSATPSLPPSGSSSTGTSSHNAVSILDIAFPYGVNPETLSVRSIDSGFSTVSNIQCLVLNTHATSANVSWCSAESKTRIFCMTGQKVKASVSALFENAPTQINIFQYVGLGDESCGVFFGYFGPEFGILSRYGGYAAIYSIQVMQGALTSGTCTLSLDGVSTPCNVSAGDSIKTVLDTLVQTQFSGWSVYSLGDMVYFKALISEAKPNPFSFVDGGTGVVVQGPTQVIRGVPPTDSWVPQLQWNVDNCQGIVTGQLPFLYPGKRNLYQMEFSTLAYSAVTCSIAGSPVHIISYPNLITIPCIQTQTLPMSATIYNQEAANTHTAVQIASFSIENYVDNTEAVPKWYFNSLDTVTFPKSVYTSMLVLKNNILFQTFENKSMFHITSIQISLTCAHQASSMLQVVLRKNAAYSGLVTFTTPVPHSSAAIAATSATDMTLHTVSGSTVFFTGMTSGTQTFQVSGQKIYLYPGEDLCVCVKPVMGTNMVASNFVVGLSWTEDR